MTIEILLVAGFVVGLLIGAASPKPMYGCLFLLAVPVGMFAYMWWWQSQNPDKLHSTSALDLLFGPLWPSLGAIGGFVTALLLRWLLQKR
jgi:hypothetical protein